MNVSVRGAATVYITYVSLPQEERMRKKEDTKEWLGHPSTSLHMILRVDR
jgi:hypothetical protein